MRHRNAAVGYERLYARIWYSNLASIAAFEKALGLLCICDQVVPLACGNLCATHTVRQTSHRKMRRCRTANRHRRTTYTACRGLPTGVWRHFNLQYGSGPVRKTGIDKLTSSVSFGSTTGASWLKLSGVRGSFLFFSLTSKPKTHKLLF
jgi:hypothetical protein